MQPKASHQITEEQINTILQDIGTSVKSYERFEGGVINPLYFLDTKDGRRLALRLTNPHWKNKTESEVMVMDFVRNRTTIPVPGILAYDLTRDRIGFEYILMERLQGEQLIKTFDQSTTEEKDVYLESIADIFVQLKSFRFPKIGSFLKDMQVGPLVDSNTGPFDTFAKYICSLIDFRIPPLREDSRFSVYVPSLERFRDHFAKVYAGIVEITLCHSDLDLKNILAHEGKITGLIDWEWAMAGPMDEDFHHIADIPDSERLIEKIVRKGIKLPQGFEERRDMYEVTFIATALVSYKHWFVGRETDGEDFIGKQCRKLEGIFLKYLSK
ncbi:MAG: aminoglycoside phosphotransferase family protein [Nanoarchaeota archaeon]